MINFIIKLFISYISVYKLDEKKNTIHYFKFKRIYPFLKLYFKIQIIITL